MRVKCILCEDTLENDHKTEVVKCTCGNLSLIGDSESSIFHIKCLSNNPLDFEILADEDGDLPVFKGMTILERSFEERSATIVESLDSFCRELENNEHLPATNGDLIYMAELMSIFVKMFREDYFFRDEDEGDEIEI